MFCVKCGQNIPDEATFCPKCGAQLNGKQGNPLTILQLFSFFSPILSIIALFLPWGDGTNFVTILKVIYETLYKYKHLSDIGFATVVFYLLLVSTLIIFILFIAWLIAVIQKKEYGKHLFFLGLSIGGLLIIFTGLVANQGYSFLWLGFILEVISFLLCIQVGLMMISRKRTDEVAADVKRTNKIQSLFSTNQKIIAIVMVLIYCGIGTYLFLQGRASVNSYKDQMRSMMDKTEEQRNRAAEALKNQTNEIEKSNKVQNEKIRQLEQLAATATEAQKKTLELEKQRLDDLKKKKEVDLAKQKADEEVRNQLEAEQIQKDLDAKKAQDELKKKEEEMQKQQEIEKRSGEAHNTKEGDQVSLNDVTIKPEKISGNPPAISSSIRNIYSGKVMFVPALILIDENGDVIKVKILTGNTPSDIKSLMEETLFKWKYSPPMKDNVRVKVWVTVANKLSF